ncbi:MmgE/PrpD family protein [Aurantiacibacter gangjinensis]|uniref:MmgE/PrpD n=1 Tax=Aurantiacibacter gangjinensis TaxID=502682 RepID=A0A0G9MMS2_9SPHN|nr:MmgE/PrpD family protein [Aurantiacibacter gangjinensis]APE28116.1 MmgE/PrpD family protein [Aurantiacibacter gangjinensis]KLE32036.1 MmgE/PrpD [Aurantiacibacter gangjinensis]
MSATSQILDFAGGSHTLPPEVRRHAERLLGDTLAVGAAGVGAPGEAPILATARAFGSGFDARLIGSDAMLPAASAAFVNGYRIHCLEWDAVHEPAVVHAMSVVTAALGAAIDRRGGCDAQEALTALAIGVDVAAGLGVAADSALTFFRPATAGVIGAALAIARIDGAPMADALGIAYSSAAGTMQAHVEGLETLPFQIANAARAAVVASDLAKAGFAGPKDALEGQFGYMTLFDQGDLSRYTTTLGERWLIAELSVKPFPSGRASHAALGALQGITAGTQRKRIELACPPLIRRLVGRPYKPHMTPAYARLCLPWLAALMLTDGRIDPRRFSAEHMADPKLAALAANVTLVADGNDDPNALFPQELRITFENGETKAHAIAHTLGSPENLLTAAQASAKYDLARELAPADADPRIFDDPLAYFTKAL